MPERERSRSAVSCFTCQVRDRTEWCVLEPEDLKRLDSAKRTLLTGELLYAQGDPCKGVYCVESGMIGVRKVDAQGNSLLLA